VGIEVGVLGRELGAAPPLQAASSIVNTIPTSEVRRAKTAISQVFIEGAMRRS
jgi:hypothetical protein